MVAPNKILHCILTVCVAGWLVVAANAEETTVTPSQKTREALKKLAETPKVISKTLQGVTDAAKAKLQEALGAKPGTSAKAATEDLTVPAKPEQPAPTAFSLDGKRDPFRPMTLRSKTLSRSRENLSPLEQFELGQLKVTGIVWDVKEPTAMIEDTGGLGYIVKVGTPIGVNEGKIKAIGRNEIIVEESFSDVYGVKKRRDVSLKLSND